VKLVELGLVDGVIHIKSQNSAGNGLFEYGISYTAPEVGSSRKSVYYATTLSEVLLNIANDNLTYALVGIPCFIKAGRLLVEQDERFQKKIKYFVGLVCGHLKSSFFAESLAWQAGIHPTDLGSIDFREKVRNSSSKNYGYSVESKFSTVKKIKRMAETVDGNWGLGVFQPEACNFCDDIFADTADIVFGDAWLPEYENSWEGTNIVIARNPKLLEILQSSKSREEIFLTEVPLSSVLDSQAGNIRHRRVGLQVRLEDDRKSNLRVPVKRVKPGYSNIPMLRRLLIRNRRRSSKASFQYFLKAKELNSLGYYLGVMKREKLIYNCFTYLGNPRILLKRIFSKLS
jgi:coenzyme F420-reducing hydrogenase beta subunit